MAGPPTPIKIGAPIALTGPLGSVGQQMKRGCEFWAKWQNAKGGLLGRPVEMVFADTAGDPAACVRKAQEMVERDGIRLLHRDHAVVRSARDRAEACRVGHHLHVVRQRRRPADRGILRAELLPRQHLRPDGHARGRALAARVEDAELLCDRPRLRLGPQQHRRVRVRGEEGEEELCRRGVFAGRHQGLLDLHHQDPPGRRGRLLHRHAGRRQQRLPVAVARIPAAGQGAAADRDRRSASIRAVGDASLGLVGSIALQLHHR